MEKIMVCPQARDSKEVEKSAELVIDISHDEDQQIKEHKKDWQDYCIYRVPKQLRKVNEEAYTPKLVSIGPFHHGKDDLKEMEKHKQRYLMDFLERTNGNYSRADLQKIIEENKEKIRADLRKTIEDNKEKIRADLRKTIEDSKEEIRRCYSEKFESDTDFVEMILLDAVFIIELFLKEKERKEKKKEAKRKGENYCEKECDYILSKPWLRIGILHDLILLENQLPFFVLEKLYACNEYSSSYNHRNQEGKQIEQHKEGPEKEDTPFVKLSRNYFRRYDKGPKSIIKVKHFTDLLRYLFYPRDKKEKCGSKQKSLDSSKKQGKESSCTRFWQSCPRKWRCEESSSNNIRYCATKLDDAGLNFKGVKYVRRLLDIRPPQPGVLQCFPCFGRPMEVPQLVIDDYTETLLRNLMALEQCHYPFKTDICNYVSLLDCLIDDGKDVDLLVHKKVIDNLLGSSKIVADLINKLCDHIVVSKPSYFNNITQKVNDHYEYPLNRTWATLKRVYFPNVFRGTATVVGLIVLFFTFWNFFKP